MTKLHEDLTDEVSEIAQRVRDTKKRAPTVSVKMVDGIGQLTIGEASEREERLRFMDALGTYDMDFLSPLLSQIGNSVSNGGELEDGPLQFVIGFIKSVKPTNEIETLLAAQMAAVHVCAMDASRRYLSSGHLAGKDSAERTLNKLTRTFAVQMEALKKHRTKAQQPVRVERVNVESGGQAIVGDVSAGGRVVRQVRVVRQNQSQHLKHAKYLLYIHIGAIGKCIGKCLTTLTASPARLAPNRATITCSVGFVTSLELYSPGIATQPAHVEGEIADGRRINSRGSIRRYWLGYAECILWHRFVRC